MTGEALILRWMVLPERRLFAGRVAFEAGGVGREPGMRRVGGNVRGALAGDEYEKQDYRGGDDDETPGAFHVRTPFHSILMKS